MSTYYKRSPINGRMIEHHLPSNVKRLKYTENELQEARADERAKVIEEVEGWLVDEEYPITDPDSLDYGKMLASPKNEWNEELRTKLNQLKGTNGTR